MKDQHPANRLAAENATIPNAGGLAAPGHWPCTGGAPAWGEIVPPADDWSEELELANLIDAPAIQSLMEDFYHFSGITMAIIDLQGQVLVGVGWQEICTRFHRVHPETCRYCTESDLQLTAGVAPGECRLYKCKNNMWDIASPLVVNDRHVGNIFSGQFFFEDEAVDQELFRAQARRHGFDEDAYIAALMAVPRFSRESVDRGMAYLMKLARMISQLSLANHKLASSLAEKKHAQEQLELVARFPQENPQPILRIRRDGQLIYSNQGGLALIEAWGVACGEKVAGRVWEITAEALESAGKREWEFSCHNRTYLLNFVPLGDQGYVNIYGRDITDRKQAELELRKLNRTLRALSNSNQTMMHAADEAALLQEVCRIITQDCGYEMVWIGYAEQDAAKTVRPVAHAGFEDGYLENLEITWADDERGRGPTGMAIRTGRPNSCRNMLTDPRFAPWREQALQRGYASSLVLPLLDGSRVLGAISIYAREPDSFLPDEEKLLLEMAGDLAYGIGVIRMRQAHARAEEEVFRQREWLRVTLNSIGDGVITCDAQARVTFLNPVAEALSGWKLENALGQPFLRVFNIINEQTRQPADNIVGRVLREKRIAELANHTSLLTKDGREIPIEDSAAPILDGAGNVTGAVLVFHDVTARRHAQETLRLSEEKFAMAFATNPAAIALTRLEDGLVLDVNESWIALNGYAREEVIGRSARQMHIWPTIEAAHRFIQELREKGSLRGWEQEFVKKSGEVFVAQLSAQILTVQGEPAILSTLVDITERKKAEEALRTANEQLAETDRRKDEFLAMLAHELRNPLAPIRNAVQILKLAGDNESVREKNRELIDRQASHMGRLLDDLLEVSRVTRGTIALKLERLDLHTIVAQAVEAAAHAAQARRLEIHYARSAEPVLLEGDFTRLEQVVGNLINNAIKYSDAGRIMVTVGREPRRGGEGPWAVVRVRDTGIGISPEMLPRVFDLFAQADQSLERTRGGLGIGLTIVKRLVELHGGRVEARSDGLGQGSEFSILLPPIENNPSVSAPGRPAPAPDSGQEESPLKVLVVDDNQDAAGSLKELLEMWGYRAWTAFEGQEAIQLAMTFVPDVVLLDIGLPGMSGYAVARKLREERSLESVRIIAMTGYGQEEDRKMTSQSGFDAHLVKPVDLHHLQIMLARIMVGS